jgi:multidrug efflux pump subunit AcrA (membrane-fusion protein)
LTARQQQIEIAGRRFGAVEVKSGLEEGDTIVIEGIVKLRDGIQVRLDEAAGAVSERSKEQHGAPGSGVRG